MSGFFDKLSELRPEEVMALTCVAGFALLVTILLGALFCIVTFSKRPNMNLIVAGWKSRRTSK